MSIENIYQCFIDYFGNRNVDLQILNADNPIKPYSVNVNRGNYVILIHWNSVDITNEYDNRIKIWDLYAATYLRPSGTLICPPEFTRSTYNRIQWNKDYLHSHVSSIHKNNLHEFHSFCFGSGPIQNTINKLIDNSDDLDIWRLYCWELDKCVHVESLAGVPYRKMAYLGADQHSNKFSWFTNILAPPCGPRFDSLLDIIKKELLNTNILKFSYVNNMYIVGTSYIETVLNISNLFIHLYNNNKDLRKKYKKDVLLNGDFIVKCCIKDNIVYLDNPSSPSIEFTVGAPMFNFKGSDVKLALKDEDNEAYTIAHIINPNILSFLIYDITKLINLQYGKPKNLFDKKFKVL